MKGKKAKGERQGHKLDKEHVGMEMPLWGWMVLGTSEVRGCREPPYPCATETPRCWWLL